MSTHETSHEVPAVRIARTFDVGAEKLFDCFTNPVEVARWWGPVGVRCPSAENDLSIGGHFRFAMRADDGSIDTAACGEYLVIERPSRLVFTWMWEGAPEPPTRVSLTFTAVTANRTRLELVHDRFDTIARAALHETGWGSCLDALADLVFSYRSELT